MEIDRQQTVFGAGSEKLSIIIPTYNCAGFLGKALASVKAEGEKRLARAQIVVVDDCSTADNPEQVVKEEWGQRVSFFRNRENLGPCANFNRCLEVADREWIHLLHGDDYLLPGAYEELAECVEGDPGSLAVFARCEIVKANGDLICQSGSLGGAMRGPIVYDPLVWARNPIYPAGVLLSRQAIHSVGKFDCHFSHVQDWNLWWRLVKTGRCLYSSKCVAGYREGAASHSARLRRTATNLKEVLEQIHRLIASLKEEGQWVSRDEDRYYEGLFEIALHQCETYLGERKPFAANWRYFRTVPASLRETHRNALRDLRRRHWRKVVRNLI